MGFSIEEKKILLIDDEEAILDLLETVLKKEGFKNVFKASTGKQGIYMFKEEKPDLIVLDIMLPDIDGYEVCKNIRAISYVPIIFLSAKVEDVDKILGFGLGGDDYVTKPFSPKEVAFRIKAHFRRNIYIEKMAETKEKIIKFGDITIEENKALVKKGDKEINFTAKEYSLLLYLAKNFNQILSKRKIFERVWGEDYMGMDNTIMVHIRHIREKIEDKPSSPKYLITVKGLGYKLIKD
ncbi:transcriptional regulatory protein YycF [Clostridium acetireducens DSM 10703]|uniref:Stage 0 sporulation protein A homolog n=1 Tax=Clostridium acetireducens DSM 10703 TaxID=1121290 RepID=A0A1E8EWS3_9CLOT|nr:response regulator transcription factor [Clostridium acetireducens]OFI05050.1 transcriptional regulatory protein YycF [Clostridium acetireducens DSM 10703]